MYMQHSVLGQFSNSVHTRCIVNVKTSGFTRGVYRNRCVLNSRFSSGIAREEALLRKSKTPRKSPEKWIFLSPAFYNAPGLHSVK